MKSILFFLTLFLSFNIIAQDQWVTLSPMPLPRFDLAATVLNDTIYIIGGDTPTTPLSTVDAYDPVSDTWTSKPSMPTARTTHGAATVNGKIYVIGGYDGVVELNVVEEYDPVINTWTTKSPMPTARSEFSMSVINDKIYVVGGQPNNLATLEIYNPSTDTWTTGAPVSLGRQNMNSSAVSNDVLYFIGGKNIFSGTVYNYNDGYDPVSDTWSVNSVLPLTAYAGAAVELDGKIHYLGGTDQQPPLSGAQYDQHFAYDPSMNIWSTELSLPSKRYHHVAVTYQNKIYMFGGLDETNSVMDSSHMYLPCIDISVIQTGVVLSADVSGQSYQWLDCDDGYSVISGEINQIYTPSSTGNYSVEITFGVCVDTSICMFADFSGNTELADGMLSLYPNPSTDILMIHGIESVSDVEKIEIFKSSGALVSSYIDITKEINISELRNGVYYIKITTKEGISTLKFIKS